MVNGLYNIARRQSKAIQAGRGDTPAFGPSNEPSDGTPRLFKLVVPLACMGLAIRVASTSGPELSSLCDQFAYDKPGKLTAFLSAMDSEKPWGQ
ncbi:hypothetical protein PIIN_00815 [Serendipita indica DSM 11827]|uniref:Uncharacterized protein n=1 Tax=Serendipita indica (strain DSM 11827) TaxID=1109443 RepID=G4T6N4_SERID|nr:hypothetical protein PIIN_00815 [Serendipita indica DSM 11827]